MTIDYYLSVGSLIAGIVTNSPFLKAVPTAFRLTATCFPRLFPLGLTKSFTSEEEAKLGRIKNLLPAICQDLGIKDPHKINLRVSNQFGANAYMIGTTSSLGGPVLCLGNTYFEKYESLATPDNSSFSKWLSLFKKESLATTDNSEFSKWLALLEEIPNTPTELGKYIDSCSQEKRKQIKDFAKKFKDVLSQDELESMLAHELGHAKHHHLLKSSGILLLIFTADKLAQVFANSIGFEILYNFASIPLVYLTFKAISRSHETEADGECAVKSKYQKGMLKFHKKELINDLFEKTSSSFESKVSAMIQKGEWTSTHPNAAKRLAHAVQLSQKQNHPTTAMTNVAWALAGLGVLSLIEMCFLDARQIWNAARV